MPTLLTTRIRGGHFEVATDSWSEADQSIRRSWTVHRSLGLSCGCGAWACALLTEALALRRGLGEKIVGAEERGEARYLVSSQHLALHTHAAVLGPPPVCKKHSRDGKIGGSCSQHAVVLGRFVRRMERMVPIQYRSAVHRGIEDFATKYWWVQMAARAAESSERRRALMKRKPRGNSAPMGWKLGRHILKQAGLPEAYLPARRDEWPAGRGFLRRVCSVSGHEWGSVVCHALSWSSSARC